MLAPQIGIVFPLPALGITIPLTSPAVEMI